MADRRKAEAKGRAWRLIARAIQRSFRHNLLLKTRWLLNGSAVQ
jgi:hypothetical protein